MLEHESVPGVVECMKITTATETKRLVHYAFQYAIKHGRKKVTLIHKAVSYIFILHNQPEKDLTRHIILRLQNIMKLTDGLFLSTATEVAKEYPHIKFDQMIIDNW